MSTKYWIIFGLILLTSCATIKKPTRDNQNLNNTIETNKENVKSPGKASAISSWEISGALAAKANKKAWTATINWQQHGANQYQIRLMGALGNGNAMIEKRNGTVTYRSGNVKESSSNPEQLLAKQTGIRLPVNNLYYWVRGIPAPGSVQSVQYDANHKISSFSQSGYNINYLSYMQVGNTYLPSKIQLLGRGTYLKLIIKNWRI